MSEVSENPYRDIEVVLGCVRSSLERVENAGLGSDAAFQELGHIIRFVSCFFRDHIHTAFPRPNTSADFQADAERALGLFCTADGFLGAMAMELQFAMAGLQIGDVRKSMKPRSRQGGVAVLEELFFKSVLVGAADRLKARGGGDAAYQTELAELGLNSHTIEGFRRQMARTISTNQQTKFRDDAQMKELVAWAKGRLNSIN